MIDYMTEEKPHNQEVDEWLTPKEVADKLKLTPRKIGDLLRSGELPSIKIGKDRRIKPADLQAFIEKRRG